MIDTTREGKADEHCDDQELKDVRNHPTERYLHRTEVWVDCEDVNQLQNAEDVGCCKQTLGNNGRVKSSPFCTWSVRSWVVSA